MPRDDMLVGLQQIFQELQIIPQEYYSIYFLTRTVAQNTPTYSILTATREPKVVENLKTDITKYTRKLLERDTLTAYMDTLEMQREELQYIRWLDVPHAFDILSHCIDYQAEDFSSITAIQEFVDQLWGYVIRIENPSNSNSIYVVKKYTKSDIIDLTKRKYWNSATAVLSIPDREMISMDKKYDAIVSLPPHQEWNNPALSQNQSLFYISRRANFENFFSYKEYYPHYISEHIQSFGEARIIDNYMELGTRCQSSFKKSLRFSRILYKQQYASMTSTKIKKYIRKHNLPITMRNNMIVYDRRHVDAILDVLEECYYTAEISGTERKATNSVEM